MGKRITWRSRPRADIPFSGSIDDVTSDDKTNWVGPMSLAQLVELFWRVKTLKFTGTIYIDFTYLTDPEDVSSRVAGSQYYSLDVPLTRRSFIGIPPTSYFESDETDIFRENLHWGGLAQWAYSSSGETEIMLSETPPILRDNSGDYWLKPFFRISADSGVYDLPFAGISHGTDTQYDEGTLSDYEMIPAVLSLGGADVNFPILWYAYEYGSYNGLDDVVITSATAAIEVTEWFPYATKAGLDAWDTATGAPANGGPGG